MRTAAAIALAAALPASTASAQARELPKLELAAGWISQRNLPLHRQYPAGVFVSIEGRYRPWLEAVGEFTATVERRPARSFADPGASLDAYLAGARVLSRGSSHLAAFGQLLAGAAVSGGGSGDPAIGIQPGAGVDIHLIRHLGVRIAADRRRLLGIRGASGTTSSIVMLRAGLVWY